MSTLSLRDLPVKDKKVLMRVDFNVPLDEKQNITDDTRIIATLPSIRNVLERGGALILMSHLGRPKGKFSREMSLAPCAKRLSELLGREVLFASDCIGAEVMARVEALKPGQVLLLENLRFYGAEENPNIDPLFAKQLAGLGDVYVNDAFGAAHRAHSSIVAVAKAFPKSAAAGILLEKEIRFLGEALNNPKRPFYAIIGGAKISTKCGVIKTLMQKADAVLLGGGMTYTFMKAQGISIGRSICEDDFLDEARKLLTLSKQGAGKLLLPKDIVIAKEIKEGTPHRIVKCDEGIPDDFEGVDIGPETINEYARELRKAATILWNGPLGVFEVPEFSKGTSAIAHILSQVNAVSVVGGGDSIAAINAVGMAEKITHLSTGGGASLEYVEFGKLPGIDALTKY